MVRVLVSAKAFLSSTYIWNYRVFRLSRFTHPVICRCEPFETLEYYFLFGLSFFCSRNLTESAAVWCLSLFIKIRQNSASRIPAGSITGGGGPQSSSGAQVLGHYNGDGWRRPSNGCWGCIAGTVSGESAYFLFVKEQAFLGKFSGSFFFISHTPLLVISFSHFASWVRQWHSNTPAPVWVIDLYVIIMLKMRDTECNFEACLGRVWNFPGLDSVKGDPSNLSTVGITV